MPRVLIATIAVLLAPLSSDAATPRWFQIPAQALWIAVPQPWQVAADPTHSALWLSVPGSSADTRDHSAMTVWHVKEASPADAIAQRTRALEKHRQGIEWSRRGKTSAIGRVSVEGQLFTVRVTARSGKGFSLVVDSIAPREKARAAHEVQDRVLKSMTTGWKRPGGVWVRVPATELRLQLADTWNTRPVRDRSRLYLDRRAGHAFLEVSVDNYKDVRAALAGAVAVSGGAAAQWGESAPWKPTKASGKATGATRSGHAATDDGEVRLAVFVWPVKDAVVVAVAIAKPGSPPEALAEIQAMVTSLR